MKTGEDGRRNGRRMDGDGRIDEAGGQRDGGEGEELGRTTAETMRRMRGKKMDAAAALLRLHLRKRNGFGDEDAAPRSKMKLPGAAQRRGEGWWPDLTGALLPCYDRNGESELSVY